MRLRFPPRLRWQTLLALFLFYQLSIYALAWIPFVPGFVVLGLPILVANLAFLLALPFPATRPWGLRMLLHSALLLALAALYALFPGIPLNTKSTIKLVGPEGGQVMTPDRMARAIVKPASFRTPLVIKVTSLPLDIPLPGPPLPPEVKLIAAAHFEQSHPFPKEWQNFFFPEVQLSLKNTVAPVEDSGYFTEICFWWPPDEESTRKLGFWACEPYHVVQGDPTHKGSGWVATTVKGFGPKGTTFYLFQYPRDWARANCEAAGGKFIDRGFSRACTGIDREQYIFRLGYVPHNLMK